MSNLTSGYIFDKPIWDRYLLNVNPHSFLQTWEWGEVNKVLGHKIIRLGFYRGRKLVGICQIICERAKRGPHFIIPAGPVLNWFDREVAAFFLKTLKQEAKKEKIWFARIRPELLHSPINQGLFKSMGFINAPMHLHGEHTLVVDLTVDEAQILSRMRKNTRYAIRKSLTEGYSLNITNTPDDADILAKLQEDTVRRHKFIGFKKEIFQKQLEYFGKDDNGALFIVSKDSIPVVAAIVIFFGDYAYYHHSGSSDIARTSNASYFMQWQIMLEARNRGKKYYDLWGIAPTDDPRHRFYGVTVFKKGFGGERLDWMHAQDLIFSPLYWATYLFETIRRKARKL